MALSEVLDAALPGTCFAFFLVFTLYWSIVDNQSCVSFRCLAMGFSFTHTRCDQQLSFPPEQGFLSLQLDKPGLVPLVQGSPHYLLWPLPFLSPQPLLFTLSRHLPPPQRRESSKHKEGRNED